MRKIRRLLRGSLRDDDAALASGPSEMVRAEAEFIRKNFDESYYITNNPDVAEKKIDPLLHFAQYGWREGRDPSSTFSVKYYLETNKDVRDAGINPLWHYVASGEAEGRTPLPPDDKFGAYKGERTIGQKAEKIREAFDSSFYLRHNPDVAESNADPLLHFFTIGWKEGRNPNAEFSVEYYLDANPDVREAGINPLWHYVVAGKAEGREIRHPGGYRAEALINTRPLEETVRAWKCGEIPKYSLTADEVRKAVLSVRKSDDAQLIISVGHDNYRDVSGGVQYCIQREEEIAAERGAVYLNLHPCRPLPRLAHKQEDPDVPVVLMLAGEKIGVAATSEVIEALGPLSRDVGSVEFVIHHLLGHNPEQIAELINAADVGECGLWLHDFFSLCPSYALQRNGVSYCGAPAVGSNACRLCLYGAERLNHVTRLADFFNATNVNVLAPSEFASEFWMERSNLPIKGVTVLPHADIQWTDCSPKPKKAGKINVAFLGYPVQHKGWPAFESIVRSFRGDNSPYEFSYFGTSQIGLDQVEVVPVHVTANNPDAMIKALSEREVDLVLHWASWGETFSFSTFEALASGAYVITNSSSGNVAATVQRLGRGVVLEDENALEEFFRDGQASELVAELRERRRTERGKLIRSDMSLAIIGVKSV